MTELLKVVLIAAGILGVMGFIFGILLAVASKVFFVKEDERKIEIEKHLSGANCGACGFAGCSAYADAIVKGEAPTNLCNSGGNETAKAISDIMGVEAAAVNRKYAKVRCSGTTEYANAKYMYQGLIDCTAANRLLDGYMSCKFGCIGFGSCAKVCPNNAISIRNGVSVIDRDKCSGCGRCTEVCPKHIIDLIPETAQYHVGCSSEFKGPKTKKNCSVGCLGCKICEKTCQNDAIHVVENLAAIDYDKCIGCGLCAEKCPKKIIQKIV